MKAPIRLFTGALVLAIGLAFLGVGVSGAVLEARYLLSGRSAEATVVEKRTDSRADQASRLYLRYRFAAPDGRLFEGTRRVHWTVYDRVEQGGPIAVQYLPANPGRSRIAGQGGLAGPLGLMALGALVCAGGLGALRRGWWERQRERRLRAAGAAATGTVTAVEETPYRWNHQQLWVVHYVYRDDRGQPHTARSGYLPAAEARSWQVGDTGDVRFDPEHPEDSVWVGRE